MRKDLIAMLCIAIVVLFVVADTAGWLGDFLAVEQEMIVLEGVEGLNLEPGVHAGVGEGGFGGPISVEVTVDEYGLIERIVVTDDSETASFMGMARAVVFANVIGTQSTGVDAVAGATLTANALIAGIENALVESAGADLETLRSGPEDD